jgi:hypothetical protein
MAIHSFSGRKNKKAEGIYERTIYKGKILPTLRSNGTTTTSSLSAIKTSKRPDQTSPKQGPNKPETRPQEGESPGERLVCPLPPTCHLQIVPFFDKAEEFPHTNT